MIVPNEEGVVCVNACNTIQSVIVPNEEGVVCVNACNTIQSVIVPDIEVVVSCFCLVMSAA